MTDDEAEILSLACAVERYMSDFCDEHHIPYNFGAWDMAQHVAEELTRYDWIKK